MGCQKESPLERLHFLTHSFAWGSPVLPHFPQAAIVLGWDLTPMIEHLVIWQIDETRTVASGQKESNGKWPSQSLMDRLRKDLAYYSCADIQIANDHGYALVGGNLSDIILDLVRYSPYLKFKLHPASDIDRIGFILDRIKKKPIQNSPNARVLEDHAFDSLIGKTGNGVE